MDIGIVISSMAFIVTLLSVPLCIGIAKRFRILDIPDQRKVHQEPTPYLGGLAIYISYLVCCVYFLLTHPETELKSRIIAFLICGTIITLVGLYDDIKGMRAIVKLSFQIALAVLLYYLGQGIQFMTLPVIGFTESSWFTIPATVIWIVIIINAINLIDGLDGLSSGIMFIAAASVLIYGNFVDVSANITLWVIAGACLGFLVYNFPPAMIFLGDTGSMLLGFLFAATSINIQAKGYVGNLLILPVLVIAIPIFDMTHAFFRRVINKKNPFKADRNHLHHVLLERGLNSKSIVLIIYLLNLNLGLSAFIANKVPPPGQYLLVFVTFSNLILMFIVLHLLSHIRRSATDVEEAKISIK